MTITIVERKLARRKVARLLNIILILEKKAKHSDFSLTKFTNDLNSYREAMRAVAMAFPLEESPEVDAVKRDVASRYQVVLKKLKDKFGDAVVEEGINNVVYGDRGSGGPIPVAGYY